MNSTPETETLSPGSDSDASKYVTLFHYIHTLNMRDVRDVYKCLRKSNSNDPDMFLPHLGITVGEFAVAHVLKQPRRPRG